MRTSSRRPRNLRRPRKRAPGKSSAPRHGRDGRRSCAGHARLTPERRGTRMGMIKVVGLVLHPRRDCGSAVDTIVNWAAARGVTVLGLPDEIDRIDCSAVPVSAEEMVERAGLLVSLGGDGTMLRSMRLVEGRKTPVLGVNVGRLGFLAEVDLPDLKEALSSIDEHSYRIESRTAVRTVLPDGRRVTAF